MCGYEKRYKLIVGSVTDSREYLLYYKFSDNNTKVKAMDTTTLFIRGSWILLLHRHGNECGMKAGG
jgi:hypothetical protein